MLIEERVRDQLRNVIDPEIGMDLVELGLIYDVGVHDEGRHVDVTFSLTSPTCPVGGRIQEQVETETLSIDGVETVNSRLTFDPMWNPEMMSPAAKLSFGRQRGQASLEEDRVLRDAGASHLLTCGDPVIEELVRQIGPLNFEELRIGRPKDAYGFLVRTIVGQQISTKAARSIYGRLTALYGDHPPTPDGLLSAEDDALRACGLSRPKIRYLRSLAEHVASGGLRLHEISNLPDEEVVAEIVAVKGLAHWSADMFLMFYLGRPDVLPVGDLGVRRAAERAYDLPDFPDVATLRRLAEPWRPHRTLASFYLWESLNAVPVTDEPSNRNA